MSSSLRNQLSALPAILLLTFLVLAPLCLMAFVSTLARNSFGGVTWDRHTADAYIQLILERDFLTDALGVNLDYLVVIGRSIGIAAATTLAALVIGFPAAVWAAYRPRKIRNILVLLIAVPFFANQLVRTYAWILLLRTGGIVENALHGLGIFSGPLEIMYTPYATSIGLTYSFLPYMILPIYVSIEKIDRRLVEAAYDLGANRLNVMRRIILPLAMPGVLSGCLLVFIPCIGSFVSPELLGGAKSMMIGNLIQGQFGELRNWPFGAALSMLVLLIVVLGLYLRPTARHTQQVLA